jgi:hypothetical protein
MKYLKFLLILLLPACLGPSNVSRSSLEKIWSDSNQLAITGTYKNTSPTNGFSLWGSLHLDAPEIPSWNETTVKITNNENRLTASLCLHDSVLVTKKIRFHKCGRKFIGRG